MRALLMIVLIAAAGLPEAAQPESTYQQQYTAKNYEYLIGMEGFTEGALKKHFTLYQGYVKNTNLLMTLLSDLSKEGKQNTPCWAELKRRLGWEWDGMRLHEYYFDNMGGQGKPDVNSEIYQLIVEQYGSYDAWSEDFKATGALRGIGWVILYQDPYTGKLVNDWIQEHPNGHLAGATPYLVMDVWEHAYMWDYGLDRKAYINAFFRNIDWEIVDRRYQEANSPQNAKLSPLSKPEKGNLSKPEKGNMSL